MMSCLLPPKLGRAAECVSPMYIHNNQQSAAELSVVMGGSICVEYYTRAITTSLILNSKISQILKHTYRYIYVNMKSPPDI